MPSLQPTAPTAHAPAAGADVVAARCKPTGRRTLTPAKLAALDHLPPRCGGPSRGEVLAAFRRAVPALGVIVLRELIELLMSRSFPQDWTGETRPMVWVSNEWLCPRLGVGNGRLKQLIGLAFEHGLIAMREAGNGQRRGAREDGKGGRILWAFGFDLSPLAARHAEFSTLAAAFEQREAEARRQRAELSSLRRDVLSLVDLGRVAAPDVADWTDVAFRARQVSSQGQGQQDIDVLTMLVGQLTAMRDDVHTLLEPLRPVVTLESDPKGSLERPLSTPTSQFENTKDNAKAQGQVPSRPHVFSPASGVVDPLRGFPVSPAFVLAVAPLFRDFTLTSRPTREEIIAAAWHVRGHLGISQDAWGEACLTLGRWEAAVAVAAIAGRYILGEVRSPGGLLRRMLELHGGGELRLDRTLRGLGARLAGVTAGVGSGPTPDELQAPQAVASGTNDGGAADLLAPRKTWEELVLAALSKVQRSHDVKRTRG